MFDDGRRFGARVTILALLLLGACQDTPPRTGDSTNLAAPIDTSPKVSTAEPLRVLGTEPFWALDIDSTGHPFDRLIRDSRGAYRTGDEPQVPILTDRNLQADYAFSKLPTR